MTAYYTTKISVKGTTEQILNVINAFAEFETSDGVNPDGHEYFTGIRFADNTEGIIVSMPEETLQQEICKRADGFVELYAEGPYGQFDDLHNLTLLERLTREANGSLIYLSISGSDSYSESSMSACIAGTFMEGISKRTDYDIEDETYRMYLEYMLPREALCRIFQIKGDQIIEDGYGELLYDAFGYRENIFYTDREDFLESMLLEKEDVSEGAFRRGMDIIKELGIQSKPEYLEKHEVCNIVRFSITKKEKEQEGAV